MNLSLLELGPLISLVAFSILVCLYSQTTSLYSFNNLPQLLPSLIMCTQTYTVFTMDIYFGNAIIMHCFTYSNLARPELARQLEFIIANLAESPTKINTNDIVRAYDKISRFDGM